MKFRRGLLALAASLLLGVSVQAQTTTPDASLTLNFTTDGGADQIPSPIIASSNGIGFLANTPANPANNQFASARTAETAQAYFQLFNIDTTIAAGSQFQLGVHAYAFSVAGNAAPSTLFFQIYEFTGTLTGTDANPNSVAIPLGAVIQSTRTVSITTVTGNPGFTDQIYYSSAFTLENEITAGTTYVLGFAGDDTPDTPEDANYILLNSRNFNQITDGNAQFVGATNTAPEASEASIFRTQYSTATNSALTPGTDLGGREANAGTGPDNAAQPIGFRFYSSAVVTAPEPGALALLVSVVMAGLAVRRRRAERKSANTAR